MNISFRILSVALLAALLWSCGESPRNLSRAQVEELARIPDAYPGLAYINMQQLRESPLFPTVRDSLDVALHGGTGYRDLVDHTGLDPVRDTDALYLAFHLQEGPGERGFLVVATGSFDPERLAAYAREKAHDRPVEEGVYRDVTLFYPGGDGDEAAFAAVDAGHLIAGDRISVEAWIDRFRDGGENAGERLDALGAMAFPNGMWLRMDVAETVAHRLPMLPEALGLGTTVLAGVHQMSISADLLEGLHMRGEGRFADDEQAQLFHDALKGMFAAARLSMSNDREMVDLLRQIDVRQDAASVSMEVDYSADAVRRLMERGRMARHQF